MAGWGGSVRGIRGYDFNVKASLCFDYLKLCEKSLETVVMKFFLLFSQDNESARLKID